VVKNVQAKKYKLRLHSKYEYELGCRRCVNYVRVGKVPDHRSTTGPGYGSMGTFAISSDQSWGLKECRNVYALDSSCNYVIHSMMARKTLWTLSTRQSPGRLMAMVAIL